MRGQREQFGGSDARASRLGSFPLLFAGRLVPYYTGSAAECRLRCEQVKSTQG